VGELLAIAPDGQEPSAEAARSAERLALDAARARFDS
jgi:hypothetical protein